MEAAAVPPGPPRGGRRDRGAPGAPGREGPRDAVAAAHPNRAKALRVLRDGGPLDEAPGRAAARALRRRRPKEATAATRPAAAAAATIGGPVAVKALAPELPHKAKLGGVRLRSAGRAQVEAAAAEVLEAARRAGAASPKVLVQEMARGHEVLVGAVVDEQFGACITMRPGGALAEAGEATSWRAAHPGQAMRSSVAGRTMRARREAARPPRDRAGGGGDRPRGARSPRAGSPRSRRTRCSSAHAARSRSTRSPKPDPSVDLRPGRRARLGSGRLRGADHVAAAREPVGVLIAQGASAAVVTIVIAAGGHDRRHRGSLGWVAVNADFSATAYITHYRALELGPSPSCRPSARPTRSWAWSSPP